MTASPSPSPTPSSSDTGTYTVTSTETPSRTVTPTSTPIATSTDTFTATGTFTLTITYSLTPTFTVTPTPHLPLSLSHNIVNPSYGWLRVDVLAPASGRTRLDVYNLLGERVRLIADWDAVSGTPYRFQWDGKNEGGQDAGNGVYVLLLRGPGGTVVRKVILLK